MSNRSAIELGVRLILGEDDRLAETVAARHCLPARHQVREHLVDRVLVEEPLVDRRRFHPVWRAFVLVPLERVPLLLFFLGELVVGDPLARELQRHRHGFGRYEKAVLDSVLETIGVRRHAAFEIEEPVRVDVDLVLRRGGESNQERVEVAEDGSILLIHRAVRFVEDDEIEVADAEAALTIFRLVD